MKIIAWTSIFILLVASAYYLVIRSFEYEVNLKARTTRGDIIETVRIWNRSLPGSTIVEVDSLNSLKQNVIVEGRKYLFDWRFERTDDTLTKINVRVSEPGHSLRNKLLIPVLTQPIELDAAKLMHEFHDILNTHLSITKVKVIGLTDLPSAQCICTTIESDQIDKANGMMKTFSALTFYVSQLNLDVNGPPMVRVQRWQHSLGRLQFDFCIPVTPSHEILDDELFNFRSFPQQRVIHAQYFGNYITSDRAWYELVEYAEKNKLTIDGSPIEYFNNNPTLGSNETEWRADIYLPIDDH